MPKIVIANTLADGFVAFLRTDGTWSRDIVEGALATTDAEAEALLAEATQAAHENRVLDPYLIEVAANAAGNLRPIEYREYIRAFGPSVAIPA